METWCKDYLHKALDWALKAPRAVETTKVCNGRGGHGIQRHYLAVLPFSRMLLCPTLLPSNSPLYSKVGLLDAALSHLNLGAGSKHDFIVALARGLGANMTPEIRGDFINDLGK